jgi:transcriptional regulator with XRE-family HTH domain
MLFAPLIAKEEHMSPQKNRRQPQTADFDLGHRIQELRTARGLSRQALARILGITQQQLHKYEKGINRLAIGRLLDIAHALDISPGTLLEDPPPAHGAYPRLVLEMMRDFQRISSHAQQEAIRSLIHTLAEISS